MYAKQEILDKLTSIDNPNQWNSGKGCGQGKEKHHYCIHNVTAGKKWQCTSANNLIQIKKGTLSKRKRLMYSTELWKLLSYDRLIRETFTSTRK